MIPAKLNILALRSIIPFGVVERKWLEGEVAGMNLLEVSISPNFKTIRLVPGVFPGNHRESTFLGRTLE